MPASQERVLFYDPNGMAGRAKGVFLRQKIRICPVTPEQTGQRVGFLAGIKGWEQETGEAIQPPGISVKLDLALSALRRAGVPQTVYKAVVTADNAGWTFAALCAELERERQAVEKGGRVSHAQNSAQASERSGEGEEQNL